MAVSKKNRRKLCVDDRSFVWWVHEGEPDQWLGDVLSVASEDGRFFVRYYLRQPPDRRFLVVEGKEFAGLPDAGDCWIRVRSPEWQADPGIKPSDVRRLIEWCLSPEEPRVRVDWLGHVIRPSG